MTRSTLPLLAVALLLAGCGASPGASPIKPEAPPGVVETPDTPAPPGAPVPPDFSTPPPVIGIPITGTETWRFTLEYPHGTTTISLTVHFAFRRDGSLTGTHPSYACPGAHVWGSRQGDNLAFDLAHAKSVNCNRVSYNITGTIQDEAFSGTFRRKGEIESETYDGTVMGRRLQ